MKEQLIWLKFSNPDDVYTIDPLFDSEKCCLRCGESLFVQLQASDLTDWSIVQPRGEIRRIRSFRKGDPFIIKQIPGEKLFLRNLQDNSELLLAAHSYKAPGLHICKGRESDESA